MRSSSHGEPMRVAHLRVGHLPSRGIVRFASFWRTFAVRCAPAVAMSSKASAAGPAATMSKVSKMMPMSIGWASTTEVTKELRARLANHALLRLLHVRIRVPAGIGMFDNKSERLHFPRSLVHSAAVFVMQKRTRPTVARRRHLTVRSWSSIAAYYYRFPPRPEPQPIE